MMELMDRASINAVEDHRPMGLDRDAGALLVAQSDAPGDAARPSEIAAIGAACASRTARSRCSTPTTPRRASCSSRPGGTAFPAIEARGLAAARGRRRARCRCCPTCSRRSRPIAAAYDVEIPVVAHAGDGNTHPIIVYDPTDPDSEKRARAGLRRGDAARHRARRHDHRRARGRPHQEGARCPTSSAPT